MMSTYYLDIIDKYNSGQALTSLAKEYGITWNKLKKILIKNGIKVRGRKKYNLDKKYFEKIDSYEKAYFLGLLWADGSILKFRKSDNFLGKVKLSLIEEDSYLIESLRTCIKYEGELRLIKKEGNRQNQKSIQIADKEFAWHLGNLGMKQNKTYEGGIPVLDEKFMPAFILGYFDGDGCFTSWENKKRIEKKCTYTLAVHPDTHSFISSFLDKNGIKYHSINIKKNVICRLAISGNIQCAKFFNLIYSVKNNIPIFLERKYLKAKYFLDKYGALIKLKYNLPPITSSKDIIKTGEKFLNPKEFCDLKKEWEEIQKREDITPSSESSDRFRINAKNKPLC